jgi:phage shock protein C
MAETRKLYRSRSNRQVAGVCGGLAQYFNLDATLIRILFVVLAVLGGSGLLLYVAMWIIVPNEPSAAGDPAGDGSPHPCGTDGGARPAEMLVSMAISRRSPDQDEGAGSSPARPTTALTGGNATQRFRGPLEQACAGSRTLT